MEKILILQTAFLGDLILTTPFIHAVRKKYPSSTISIVVAKGTELVLEGNPCLNQVLSLDKKKAKKNLFYFFSFLCRLRKMRPDLVYCPHFSFRSTLMAYFSGAKQRIGYKESGFSFLHTRTISRPLKGKHEVEKLFSLLYDSESEYPIGRERRPFLYPSERAQASAMEKLSPIFSIHRKYIVVCPSSIWNTKRYIPEGYAELIVLILQETMYSVVLTGSIRDRDLNQAILFQVEKKIKENTKEFAISHENWKSRILDLAGCTDLSELGIVIRESLAIVTNDSSPVHYASAFNKPTVVIYGATVPDFGYYGLMDKQRICEVSSLSCRPCGIHGGHICPQKHFRCMKDQAPSQIFRSLLEIAGE